MTDSEARIEASIGGGLTLIGRVDFSTVSDLRVAGDKLLDAISGDVTIDLSQSSFRGSAGLVLIAAWLKRSAGSNAKIFFSNVPESLNRISSAYGVTEILGLDAAGDCPADE